MPRQRREETAQRWASRFAQFENSNLSVGFSTFYFLLSTFYHPLSDYLYPMPCRDQPTARWPEPVAR